MGFSNPHLSSRHQEGQADAHVTGSQSFLSANLYSCRVTQCVAFWVIFTVVPSLFSTKFGKLVMLPRLQKVQGTFLEMTSLIRLLHVVAGEPGLDEGKGYS